MRDFNEVTFHAKKNGGRPFHHSQSSQFQEWVNHAGLVDLGFYDNSLTSTNARDGIDLIKERSSHALVNAQWLDTFPQT